MKKLLFVFWGLVISIVLICSTQFVWKLILKNKDKSLYLKTNKDVGVWWWDKDAPSDNYLKFAKKNGVDEIYYCDYDMNENAYQFVKKAQSYGFKVYALWGECYWINDKTGFDELVLKYRNYQTTYSDAKFSGVHLDVEPHQLDEFSNNREDIMLKFVTFANAVVNENLDITFDFDIPFWAHDMVAFGNELKPVYAYLIDFASRAFVMSYRDSAEAIVEVAKEELEYAKTKNKVIALCVEMTSKEGDEVSFQEESKTIFYNELKKVEELVDQSFMFSIHQIKTWFDLKEV